MHLKMENNRVFTILVLTVIHISNIQGYKAHTNDLLLNSGVNRYEDDLPGSKALDNFPLIDGHNDLPWNLYNKVQNKLEKFDFEKDLSEDPVWGSKSCNTCHTDLPRMRVGKVSAQFWVAYVECETQYKDAVTRTLDQIDVIKRFVKKYGNYLQFTTTADGILDAFRNNKIASLIGVEGGHSIDYRFSILRIYYELGVRYLTLTHTCNTPWADGSPVDVDNSVVRNLTDFGKKIVLEMNRLGMMVDLSHVSHHVMSEVLNVSAAPVIFSHSSSYAIYPHHRNVRDDILRKVKINGGVVMVNFYTTFVGKSNVTIYNVIDHINHIVDISGINSVGIGSDFDGVESTPTGLEDLSKYPRLFDLLKELNPERWTIENLEKLAGRNLIRVFEDVEYVRDSLVHMKPNEEWIPAGDLRVIDDVNLSICHT